MSASPRQGNADPYTLKAKYTNRQNKKYALFPVNKQTSQFQHPNINREVRHNPTWHSSESESALKRFEAVAVVKLRLDGRSTLFALVAARRQKKLKEESFPLFVLFVLFGQAKRTP